MFQIYNTNMVNKKHESVNQEDIEITIESPDIPEPDLSEIETHGKDIISSLRSKLKACEADKREALEDSQRAKADFLNARSRLNDEKIRDRERYTMNHIEELIPLCDSFQMAMANKEVWEKADETWRKGILGIYSQLEKLLVKYKVVLLNPLGEQFDPRQHEALSMTTVDDAKDHDKVVAVIQSGYEITHETGATELIRPARVSIGVFSEK